MSKGYLPECQATIQQRQYQVSEWEAEIVNLLRIMSLKLIS